LEKARRDKRIVGIYLNGSRSSEATGTDFATLKEVRAALNGSVPPVKLSWPTT